MFAHSLSIDGSHVLVRLVLYLYIILQPPTHPWHKEDTSLEQLNHPGHLRTNRRPISNIYFALFPS
jgi:hypothetical protein